MLGLERGIERAIGKINTVAYVEIETFIIENLVQQMEKGLLAPAPIWSDVKTFIELAPYFRGKICGITGGYPCQPFSVAGKQKGVDDPRHLWPYIKQIIKSIEPVWCFFENVPGHLTIGYEQVRNDLRELGYSVKEGIYSAEEVGAPHQRKRLFILAVLANTKFGGWNDESFSVTNSSGCEGDEQFKSNNARRKVTCKSASQLHNDFKRDEWPAKPGENQYEWEAQRTESSMGFTINGYNYREDLLRMAGNGVVEQAAEVAFIDLLNKHLVK